MCIGKPKSVDNVRGADSLWGERGQKWEIALGTAGGCKSLFKWFRRTLRLACSQYVTASRMTFSRNTFSTPRVSS